MLNKKIVKDVSIFAKVRNFLPLTKVFIIDQYVLQEVFGSFSFLEMIFLLNQCFDLVVKPSGVLVITDYIFVWNEIVKNIKDGLVEEIKLLINILIFD